MTLTSQYFWDKKMSVVFGYNHLASNASNNVATSTSLLQKSLIRLSTGSKIVNPADDAGGLGVSMKLSAKTRRQRATRDNIANTVSFLQTQDGALKTIGKILDRISELKVLHSDPTKNASDRSNYDLEYSHLRSELTAISEERYNGNRIFGTATKTIELADQESSGDALVISGTDLFPEGQLSWNMVNPGINSAEPRLAYGAGRFIGGWGTAIATSTDGTNWTQIAALPSGSPPYAEGVYSIAYGGGKYVAGGNWNHVWSSADGVNWTHSTYGRMDPINAIIYDGHQYIGVGNVGMIITSPDAINWTQRSGPTMVGFSGIGRAFLPSRTVHLSRSELSSPEGNTVLDRNGQVCVKGEKKDKKRIRNPAGGEEAAL